MYRLALSFLVGIMFLGDASAGSINPFEGPRPIAVLIKTNPWLWVVGSDTPELALYEDGQIVYLKKEKDSQPVYMWKQLSNDELRLLTSRILGVGDFQNVKRTINLVPGASDLPKTRMFLDINGKQLITTVYGPIEAAGGLNGVLSSSSSNSDLLPDVVKNLHSYLRSLEFDGARPWVPKFVEVMIWEFKSAPESSIDWPKKWPGLNSASSFKRGDSYSIFLPGHELGELRDFLNTRKEKGAIEIDGRKWAASVRYTFPCEPVWVKAFRESR